MKTKLEVINYLIGISGSSPVANESIQQPDVINALLRWEEANTEIQKTAWWFNQEYKFEMIPDATTKEIEVPLNVLSCEVTSERGIVKRGNKLYDTVNHTYQFDHNVYANQLIKLEFELLDEVVIDAMRYFAAMLIAELDLEDAQKANTIGALYTKALAELRKADLKAQRRNALASPTSLKIVTGARYNKGRSINPYLPGGF